MQVCGLAGECDLAVPDCGSQYYSTDCRVVGDSSWLMETVLDFCMHHPSHVVSDIMALALQVAGFCFDAIGTCCQSLRGKLNYVGLDLDGFGLERDMVLANPFSATLTDCR